MKKVKENQWKPDRDSAKKYCWVRLTKWDWKREIGKVYTDIQSTLEDISGLHTGPPRGLDSAFKNGKPYKLLLGQKTRLQPKMHNNSLFAELVALKVNIVASQMEITPPGFGELVYNEDNQFSGMSINEIVAKADSACTFKMDEVKRDWAFLLHVVSKINRAFEGTIGADDTISFVEGGMLKLSGEKLLTEVPFLKLGNNIPKRINRNPVASYDENELNDEQNEVEIPNRFALYQNYPNPFNPSTTIKFNIPKASYVTLKIYNLLGQEVAELLNEEKQPGVYTVNWNASGFSSGVYFYKLTEKDIANHSKQFLEVKKLILIK